MMQTKVQTLLADVYLLVNYSRTSHDEVLADRSKLSKYTEDRERDHNVDTDKT